MSHEDQDSTRHDINQKLMTLSVALLIVAWFFVVLFHVYARCYGARRPDPHLRRHVTAVVASRGGLDPSAVNALPTFAYESKNEGSPLECAVCISEFEDGETGRVLPDCNHCVHVGCIDMWLQSHRDCPLCRTRVMIRGSEPVEPVEGPQERSVSVIVNPVQEWRPGLNLFVVYR